MKNMMEISVDQMTALVADLVIRADEKGLSMARLHSFFFWGTAGIGKSAGVRQIAGKVEAATGKKTVVTDLRLAYYNPQDLQGIPAADKDRTHTVYLIPRELELDPSPSLINILFLDELNSAVPAVMRCAYQITLDRCVGSHALPDNCVILAAGNRTTDHGIAYVLPRPLANRMCHFQIRADYASWARWAREAGISEYVREYLAIARQKLLSEPDDPEEYAYPSPRSWEAVSDHLTTMGCPPASCHALIASAIGIPAAVEFEAFCRSMGMPAPEKIAAGRVTRCPSDHDSLYTLLGSLTDYVLARRKRLTPGQMNNIAKYAAEKFPPDFASAFFSALTVHEDLSMRLMETPAFRTWLTRHGTGLT